LPGFVHLYLKTLAIGSDIVTGVFCFSTKPVMQLIWDRCYDFCKYFREGILRILLAVFLVKILLFVKKKISNIGFGEKRQFCRRKS
jgi:hypothetical protein